MIRIKWKTKQMLTNIDYTYDIAAFCHEDILYLKESLKVYSLCEC